MPRMVLNITPGRYAAISARRSGDQGPGPPPALLDPPSIATIAATRVPRAGDRSRGVAGAFRFIPSVLSISPGLRGSGRPPISAQGKSGRADGRSPVAAVPRLRSADRAATASYGPG